MTHTKSRSVADIRAMFEKKSTTKQESKPRETITATKHSSSDFWENRFKIKQPELIQGPTKTVKEEWDHEKKEYESKQSNPGKVGKWNPQNNFTTEQGKVGKLSLSDQFTQQLVVCNEKKEVKKPEPIQDAVINHMMTCEPEKVITPEIPQAPSNEARAYFSDYLICQPYAVPWDLDGTYANYSDYVGAGSYPANRKAFPNAAAGTFDAIAIDANTRVILWEQENFQGKVLLDVTGPVIINNTCFQSSYASTIALPFQDLEIEKTFPQSVRIFSETDMKSWTNGSVKIVVANQ